MRRKGVLGKRQAWWKEITVAESEGPREGL